MKTDFHSTTTDSSSISSVSASKSYKSIRSDSLSSAYDPRFVIVDVSTGEVLDDAQGYGYKSAQKAYAAWSYKTRSPEKKAKMERIEEWLCRNKRFTSRLEQCAFYAFEDMVEMTSKDVAAVLEEGHHEGYLVGDVPGTPVEIFRVWSAGKYQKNHRRRSKKKSNR